MTRQFFIRLFLFALPFVAYATMILVLPIDVMTFRSWEALSAYSPNRFNGPFYPNVHLDRMEVGDLGPHSKFAQSKHVTFDTDDFGNRSYLPRNVFPEVVIAGDSMGHGSGMDQREMLAEQLAERLPGHTVYTVDLKAFFHDPRLKAHPPRVLVVEQIERSLRRGTFTLEAPPREWLDDVRDTWGPARSAFVALDRVQRAPVYATLSLGGRLANRRIVAERDEPPAMLFSGAEVDGAWTEAGLTDTLRVLERLRAEADRRVVGRERTRLVVLPVPDKENIYAARVPESIRVKDPDKRGDFLRRFRVDASARGLTVCDLQDAFEKNRELGLYQPDDTHWGPVGVRIAADLLAEHLRPMLQMRSK